MTDALGARRRTIPRALLPDQLVQPRHMQIDEFGASWNQFTTTSTGLWVRAGSGTFTISSNRVEIINPINLHLKHSVPGSRFSIVVNLWDTADFSGSYATVTAAYLQKTTTDATAWSFFSATGEIFTGSGYTVHSTGTHAWDVEVYNFDAGTLTVGYDVFGFDFISMLALGY